MAERTTLAVRGRDGRRPEVHHAGTPIEHPLELGDGGVGIGEREHRHAVDAVLVREAPVLVEPLVERVEHRVRRFDVVAQHLLDPDRERREHDHAFEALLVHHREPCVAVLVLSAQRLELHQRTRVDALGDLAAEHEVHAPGDDDRVEGGVGDELEQLPAHEQERVRALLHHLHAPLAELLGEVPGAGVEGLVVVVVGVDGAISELHGVLSRSPCGALADELNVITFRTQPRPAVPCPGTVSAPSGADGQGGVRAHHQGHPIAREARADRRRAARADRQRSARGGRVARARARPGRALRGVTPVAPRGAAHPRGRGPDHRRARGARRGGRAPAERAHDRPHRRARPPGPQRDPGRRAPGAQHDRTRCGPGARDLAEQEGDRGAHGRWSTPSAR